MDNRQTRKVLMLVAVVVMVITLAVTAALLMFSQKRAQRERDQLQERIELAKEYEEKIEKNDREIISLEAKQSEYEKLGHSMMSFLFMQCSNNLYDEVFEYMTGWRATGFFTVSLEEHPGKEGCITVEQYQEMCSASWVPLVLASEEKLSDEYLKEIDLLFSSLSIERPTALAFGRRAVSKAEVDLAASKGYTVFLYDIEKSSALPEQAKGEDRQFIPFFYSSRKSYIGGPLSKHLADGQSATIGFGRVTTQVSEDRAEHDQMLSSLRESVCDLAQGFGYYTDSAEYLDTTIRVNTVIKEELVYIAERLDILRAENIELRRKINTIYQSTDEEKG